MSTLLKFTRFSDSVSEFFGRISTYLVVLTVVIGVLNVVLRYLGRFVEQRLTSNLLIELQWYLYSLIFFFGFAYILKNGINVRVDFWFAELSAKRKAIIDLIGHFVALLPFCVMGIYVTINPVLTSWGRRRDGTWGTWELSPDPSGLPRAPIKTMIIVAFVLLLMQAIAEVIKLIAILRDEEHLIDSNLETEQPIRIE